MKLSAIMLAFVVAVATLSAARSAHAGKAPGTWKSDSGNTFIIPESSTDFDLIRKTPAGATSVFKGHWIEGMVGTQFSYTGDDKISCTATFNSRDPDKLRVQCGKAAANMWERVADAPRQHGLVGTWKSTSGNRFTIPERSKGEFDILVTHTDGSKEVYKAKWVEGMEGTQFVYGAAFGNTGTRNGNNPNQIRVVDAKGVVNVWERAE